MLFRIHFWSQHVDFPTRKDPRTEKLSMLDPCLCSNPEIVIGVESQGWFSDHAICTADLIMPSCNSSVSKELVPDWAKADLDKLVNNLAMLDWESELKGMSGLSAWELLKQKIDEETSNCVPRKLRRVSNRPLWMNKNVMRLVRKKRRLWKWYTSSGHSRNDYQEYLAYKEVQIEVRKAVKNAKRNFERKLARDAIKNNTKP